tara:strand:+ start:15965 stop:16975 length:1011 start_codon:yes stop_codon:yes gene_type:complete
MIYENFIKDILDVSGIISPIYIDNKDSKGTGLCNASILYNDNRLMMILRNVEYTLYHCEGEQQFQSRYEGPLSYYHRDDDLSLRTTNFYCELDPQTLKIIKYNKINTEKLDVKPIWNFIGLEDARLIYWDNKYYACGVRRDTTTNGQGRMEMSELDISDNYVKEINRNRIQVPDTNSYCEKNWMPIKDKPFHFIKWTNPTELVKIDLSTNTSQPIYKSNNYIQLKYDLRGGSQLIPWDDNTYIAIVHECKFISSNYNKFKDAEYYHKFVIWNSDWSIKFISKSFNFITAKVEFCTGLEQIDNDIVITFGFQDNACYAVKVTKKNLNDLIWNKLKPN